MFSSLKRIIYSGWKIFSRNQGFSIATIFILMLALLLVNTLFLLKDTSEFLFSELQEKVDVSVYFKDDVPEPKILEVKQSLEQFNEIKEIEYISKEEALYAFTQKHKNDYVLMESLEELGTNPFFASLNIMAWEASQYKVVSEFLEKDDFKSLINNVDYSQKEPIIAKIFFITSYLKLAGIVSAVILSLMAILVAFNQIRLAIVSSKEEIKIMRLVGATNWFICGPFIVQGIIAGVFAVLIANLVFGLFCFFLAPQLEILIPGFNIYSHFESAFIIVFSIQLIVSMSLGVISSAIAIRKYLKI